MIQRRAADLGARIRIGYHTFRATGITAHLEAGESAHDETLRPDERRETTYLRATMPMLTRRKFQIASVCCRFECPRQVATSGEIFFEFPD
jgi:hypothetical protein